MKNHEGPNLDATTSDLQILRQMPVEVNLPAITAVTGQIGYIKLSVHFNPVDRPIPSLRENRIRIAGVIPATGRLGSGPLLRLSLTRSHRTTIPRVNVEAKKGRRTFIAI